MAVGLFSGAQVVGAVETADATVKMTYVDYDNPETSMGEIAAGSTAKSGYNKISGGSVGFGNISWGVNYITYIQVDASSIEGTITGATLTADCSGSTDSKRKSTWGVGYNSSEWSSQLTYNTADKSITTIGATATTTSTTSSDFNNLSFDVSEAFAAADGGKIVTLLVYATNAAGGYIKNPKVTISYVSSDAKATTYTVKFVNKNNETIKQDAVYDTFAGTSVTASADDMATFYNSEETEKYVYCSGNKSITAVETATENVITLVFDAYKKDNYNITATDGNITLGELASGTAFMDGSTSTSWSKYIKFEDVWYETAADYGVTITEDTKNMKVTYTKPSKDIVYFVECEKMNTSRNPAATLTGVKYSGGVSPRHYSNSYWYTDPFENEGVYDLTAPYQNNNSSSTTINIYIRKEDGTLEDTGLSITGKTGTGTLTASSIKIPAGCSLVLNNTSSSNSNVYIDYIVLTKAVIPVEISSDYGYSTFSSDMDVDFSANESVTVYTAKMNEDNTVVKLTEVADKKVPAGEGVLLKGEGTFTGVATTGVAAFTDNAFVASEGGTTVTRADGIYVLNNKSGIGFYPFVGTLSKGKAHLVIANSDAKSIKMSFGDETTGINEIEKTSEVNGVYHTLSGIRVQNPTKGLYILNGKKVVIK